MAADCHDNQQKPKILSKFGFHAVQNIWIHQNSNEKKFWQVVSNKWNCDMSATEFFIQAGKSIMADLNVRTQNISIFGCLFKLPYGLIWFRQSSFIYITAPSCKTKPWKFQAVRYYRFWDILDSTRKMTFQVNWAKSNYFVKNFNSCIIYINKIKFLKTNIIVIQI